MLDAAAGPVHVELQHMRDFRMLLPQNDAFASCLARLLQRELRRSDRLSARIRRDSSTGGLEPRPHGGK